MCGSNQILTAAQSPISLATAKSHLRIMHALDDASIQFLIDSATESIEQKTGRQLRPSTASLTLDEFPDADDYADDLEITLPRSPFTGLTSVQYLDTQDVLQTLANVRPIFTRTPGEIHRPPDSWIWPITRINRPNAVQITYACGYAAGLCPTPLKAAILLHVERDYHEFAPMESARLDERIQQLIAPYVIRDKRLIEISDQQ